MEGRKFAVQGNWFRLMKIGKRKYHRGHVVEGQWVFGGIEEDSRKCFIATVEDRTEETLLNLIKEWIEPRYSAVKKIMYHIVLK